MPTTGYIGEDGIYHKGIDKPMPSDVDMQYRDWSHSEQRKRHSKDITQPYKNGEPNRDFVLAYEGDATEVYFTKEQIRKSERSLS